MRYLEPDQVLLAVSDVLREVVLPDAASRFVQGQIWAAIGLLENLAVRVSEKDELMAEEIDLLGSWLDEMNVTTPPTGDSKVDHLYELRRACKKVLQNDVLSADNSQRRSLEVRLQTLASSERALRRPINFSDIFQT
jgi:hypothetical protein